MNHPPGIQCVGLSMTLFFLFFILTYGLMHMYVFLKMKSAIGFGLPAGIPLMLFFIFMTFCPFLIRISEREGYELTARLLSFSGYMWMGLILLFFAWSVPLDLYRAVLSGTRYILGHDLSLPVPTAGLLLFIPLFFSLATVVFGYYSALNVRTEYITVKTSKILSGSGKIRIAQISDVHVGLIIRKERLDRIASAVKEAQPDIVVSTGDLVDGQINRLAGFSDILFDMKAPLGKFAVTGNHEYYAGLAQSLDFTRNSGFSMLRGEAKAVTDDMYLVGLDDMTGLQFGDKKMASEQDVLSNIPRDKFVVLLKHRPLFEKASLDLFDLQLSGHTHKGQIFPYSLLVQMYYQVPSGFAYLSDRASVYVSRGSGTWGPPIRLFSSPEVTIIDLIPAS